MFRNNFVSFRAMLLAGAVMSAAPAHAAAADMPSDAAAADDVAQPAGSDIIVTAQKREERIQDVPIAISAFSAADLDNMKIEGGSELLRSVPNLNFSKSFSSMYNVSIRGIGTKALNSSSDPGVAIAFNNTPMIRNRMFEQEFYDLQRVEVLRGPQGTLYGRNSTAGVINIIPAIANPDKFEGLIKGETGSYSTRRLTGMLNIPLGDTFAIRGAGAMTKRNGFDYNTFTNKRVNGRDLWSTRFSASWEPSSNFKANLIWEHFEEDDNRARTGKALCTTDPGPEKVGDSVVPEDLRPIFSQGCLPGSLYDDAAFGVPNGRSQTVLRYGQQQVLGFTSDFQFLYGLKQEDPFRGITQSRDPRKIATATDPVFRAKNDVVQINMELDVSDGLTLVSQTAYGRDRWYSSQDYNRFVSAPIFNDTTGLLNIFGQPFINAGPTPNGIYVDAQLGASDRLLTVDLNRTNTRQWNQELRLQSDFSGGVNFNVGVNYLDFKTRDDYYAFSNIYNYVTDAFQRDFEAMHSAAPEMKPLDCVIGSVDPKCAHFMYKDINPIGQLDDLGHNYFLSRNEVRTKSWGLFGEVYWSPTDDFKLTVGGRYTSDKKFQSQIPTQLLLNSGLITGGSVNHGYPRLADIDQKWGRFTGRIVADWKPQLSFTDDTLIYGSVSRGYKGGGANPPRIDFDPRVVKYLPLSDRYRPEYLTAFEIGTKNILANNRVNLNATAFFYDYQDYQISQVTDRITHTENYDAQTWGVELEAIWQPSRNFRLNGNLGYLGTRIKDGARGVDVMNRTQSNEDWMVIRPWMQMPANCIAPKKYVEKVMNMLPVETYLMALCPGSGMLGTYDSKVTNPNIPAIWQVVGFTYDPLLEAPNGGRGFDADLSGNELPNAPKITLNLGAEYKFFIENNNWELTFRGDYYRQSKSYARVYNTDFDRLKAWDNFNLAVTLDRPSSGLSFQLYVKNVFNTQPITDVFLSADDIGMPANVFYTDPRIIGFNVTKKF